MGAGQYLSTSGEPRRVPRAFANGIGAGVGCLLPVVAFIALGPGGAAAVLVAMTFLLAAAIPSTPWWRSWVETGITISVVTGVCSVTAAFVH